MNVTKETTGDLTAVLKIDVLAADYADAVAAELKEYRKTIPENVDIIQIVQYHK